MISGSMAQVVNSLPQQGNELTDYYVPNSDGTYQHYRWINNTYKAIGSNAYDKTETYNKTEIDNLVAGDVKYTEQTLTSEQKAQARANIGAASQADLDATSTVAGNALLTAENAETELANKVSSVSYDPTTYELTVVTGETTDTYTIQGGGGGSSGYSARIINGLSSTTFSVADTQTVILPFTYIAYDGSDIDYQDGIMSIDYKLASVNDWTNYRSNVTIASNVQMRLDVTDLLTTGYVTNIRITCNNGRSGDDAVTRTLQYNITRVQIGISSTFIVNVTINFTLH